MLNMLKTSLGWCLSFSDLDLSDEWLLSCVCSDWKATSAASNSDIVCCICQRRALVPSDVNPYRAYIFGDEAGFMVLGLARPRGHRLPRNGPPSIRKNELSTRGLSIKHISTSELRLHLIAVSHTLKSFAVKHLI